MAEPALPPPPDRDGGSRLPWFVVPVIVIGALGAAVLVVLFLWLVLAYAAFE